MHFLSFNEFLILIQKKKKKVRGRGLSHEFNLLWMQKLCIYLCRKKNYRDDKLRETVKNDIIYMVDF